MNRTVFFFNESLDRENTRQLLEELTRLDAKSAKPIHLLINSAGGDVTEALSTWDIIRSLRSPVIGTVIGNCFSASVLILQACDVRRAMPHSTIMMHEDQSESVTAMPIGELRADVNFWHRSADTFRALIAERTGLTSAQIERFEKQTTYFSAEEAMKHSLLDEVVARPSLRKGKFRRGT